MLLAIAVSQSEIRHFKTGEKKKNTSNIHIFNEWFISDHCPEHQQSFQSSVGEEAGASDLQWN